MKTIKLINKKNIIMLSLFAIICFFILPYFFPSKQLSISASYDYGFNNRLGMLLLAFFSIIFLLISFLNSNDTSSINILNEQRMKVDKKTFIILELITLLALIGLWFALGRDFYGIIESGYFIPHIYDILFGKVLYKDFGFMYGPIFLYVPYYIFKTFSFLNTSISDAYMLFLIINQLLGLYFLYYIFSFLNILPKEKNVIFSMIAIISFPFATGLNYTLFRFLLPFFSLLLIQKNINKKYISIIFLAIVPIFSILTSPEIGIGLYFTLFTYLFVQFILNKNIFNFIKLFFLIIPLLIIIIILREMFQGLISFTLGGLNWPFVISFSLIFFFLSTFIISWVVGKKLHNIKDNISDLSIILLSFTYIPAALGRCDPGHVLFYGLFIFILAYISIRKYLKHLKIVWCLSSIILLFSMLPVQIKVYIPLYGFTIAKNILSSDNKIPSWFILIGKLWGGDVEEKINNRKIQREIDFKDYFANIDDITMPFVSNDDIYFYLNKEKKYNSLYFHNPSYVGSKYAVDRNLMELERKGIKYILIPSYWNDINLPSDYSIINILFFTYYPLKPSRNGNTIYNSFINFIHNNYHFVNNFGNYDLYRINSSGMP